jgi:guanine deaminase
MSEQIAKILDDSGIEQPCKRQRVEEAVLDLVDRTAEKAALRAASSAVDSAVDKCNAFWKTKIGELAAESKNVQLPVAEPKPTCGAGSSGTADEACMQTAVASARVGVRLEHGGPFGASIVRDGVVISCAHNMVLHSKDPTCHAEMTAIRWACKALGTHDLSDCNIYTTCEPCPMCWGAMAHSRLNKAYIGVDRHTAAKYGFDDKVFYEEIDGKSGAYGWKRFGVTPVSPRSPVARSESLFEKNMVEIYDGILRKECEQVFTNPAVNRTYRRRYAQEGAESLHQAAKDAFPDAGVKRPLFFGSIPDTTMVQHESYMRKAIEAVERCAKNGSSKEREPFGAVIVKDGNVIATACNSVCSSRDSTATAEVNAIREATVNLCTYNLEGCEIYTTVQPDVMSLGAILWSRISRVYCGVTQKFAAQYGFEEATLHFKDLMEAEERTRLIEVVNGISMAECEAVFKEWSDRNGVIY